MNLNRYSVSKTILDVSCLASCYQYTDPFELEIAVESLFTTSYIPAQIVLVIDGPVPDKLESMISNLLDIYPISCVYNDINLGLGPSLAKGIHACTYDIVIRFDTDDINISNRVYTQYQYLLDNPSISCCSSDVIEVSTLHDPNIARIKTVPKKYFAFNSLFRNPINHPSVAFRKSVVLSLGNYESCLYFEDYLLWITMIVNGHKISNISDSPLVVMDRPSLQARRSGFKYFKSEFNFAIVMLKKGFRFFPFVVAILIRIFIRIIIASIYQLRSTPWRSSWQNINHINKYIRHHRDLAYIKRRFDLY